MYFRIWHLSEGHRPGEKSRSDEDGLINDEISFVSEKVNGRWPAQVTMQPTCRELCTEKAATQQSLYSSFYDRGCHPL
ncbi:uncharacterized protein PHALS_00016 [Plasmopara halstedii]|uniref:Uncharacterized protein n=1 Tax=Plasmopara halstedii TaxID=4781 RepID=A0A0P1ARX0_PLAHL|nr:uncharacterized protein PHALS_00016 [Plasmopara halstedii]CEG44254.1 hypothetical protein PHALS_00016 [Plasmopara halstedii]|eukprot:XP_024580623.1 hypothetical protein PHALS_00016 [Plasmopara halstedii]